MIKLYETRRFYLRNLEPGDAKGMFELDSDPAVHTYLGKNPLKNIDECHEILTNVQKQYEQNGMGRWAIIDKETGSFVGWTGLKLETKVRDFDYYDIGYRLIQRFWGKGIATETALYSMHYGFTELKLPQICGTAHVDNTASNKVLKKIGLEEDGLVNIDGDDCVWYSVNREAWLAKELY